MSVRAASWALLALAAMVLVAANAAAHSELDSSRPADGERLPLQVTLHLLHKGPAKHKDLADALGMGKSKLSFHLRKLEAAGIVAKDGEGRFGVTDAPRVERLLTAFPPTKDLRDEFADVWLNLYGEG